MPNTIWDKVGQDYDVYGEDYNTARVADGLKEAGFRVELNGSGVPTVICVNLDDMNKVGDFPLWLTVGVEVRKHPFARAILAASFASPLLAKLRQRNIYYHS